MTSETLKSDANSWRYTNLKIKSRFYERQNLGNSGLSISQKYKQLPIKYLSALGNSILSYLQVEGGYGDDLASIFSDLVTGNNENRSRFCWKSSTSTKIAGEHKKD